MNAGSKFLWVIGIVFSVAIVYRVEPGAAIAEAIVLLILLGVAARHIGRP